MLGGSGLPPLDLQAVLRYGITALALIFGLLVLVRNAASRYFVVDGGFGGESGGYDARGPEMPGGEEKCFVCGMRGIKKCARCKSVRYWRIGIIEDICMFDRGVHRHHYGGLPF